MKCLQSLSYKTLFTILFLSLAGIVFFIRIGGKTQKVSAAWWDEMWHYRKAISIENSSGTDLTDFQVSISVGTSQLIAEGKMQTDCDDIRITDINGNLVPYWIEENNPGCNQVTDTKIWLKTNSLPTSGATIYLYYGSSSAGTVSNVTTTFGPLQKLSLGASYTVAPSPQASYPDNSGRQLTNGLIREDLYQTTEATVGWNYQNPVITINLNKIAVISSFKFYLGGGGAGGINIPSQITTSYSLDNSNYTSIGVGNSWTNIEQWVTINNNSLVAAKYGQSTITSNQWAMVGEIEVYGYPGSSITASTSSTIQSEELSPGPIAYWKFDEGIGTTAYDSMGNYNGNINGTTWQTEENCISGKCLSFNGTTSDFVNTNYGNNRNMTDPISISMWIKPISPPSNKMFFGPANGNNQRFYFSIYNGKWDMGIQTGAWGGGTEITTWDQWHHIEITANGSVVKMYVNNKLVSTKSYTPYALASNLYIGYGTSSGYYFNGLIDEVKIYPYARTADQIKQDYNSRGSLSGAGVNLGVSSNTAPSLKTSLIAHWKFDENNNSTAFDSIGTNNGTLSGETIPTWVKNGHDNSAISLNGSGTADGVTTGSYVSIPENITRTDSYPNGISYSIWLNVDTDAVDRMSLFYGSSTIKHIEILSSSKYFRTEAALQNGYSFGSGTFPYEVRGKWSNFIIVFANNEPGRPVRWYQNGKLFHTGSLSGGNNPDTEYFSFNAIGRSTGSISYSYAQSFKGKIDDFRIYNATLTEEQIKQIYNAGSAIQFGSTSQSIGGTTTSLEYCIPGDTSYCASPIAEWKMDEGVGTSIVDTSSNNNTGTLGAGNSSPTWTQGKIGKGLNFDGASNKYISISNNINIGPSSWTISGWVKIPSSTVGRVGNFFGNFSDSPNLNLEVYTSGEMRYYWNGEINQLGTTNLKDDKWHYITWIRDKNSNSGYMYIDGKLEKSFLGAGSDLNFTTPFWIGSDKRSGGLTWHGQIDHVLVYNYARTPAQIAYDYNKGGPIGWWKFDECQGSTAYDWSGNQNNGTIIIGSGGFQNSLGTCAVGTSAAWTNGASGKINSSLNFDGTDDYVSVINNNLFNFSTNDFTISLWAKKPTNTFQQYGPLISKGIYSGVGEWNLYEYGSNNSWNLYCNGSNNFRFNADIGEKWGHILIGRRMDQMFIYFNGQITNPTSDTISGNNIDFTNTKNLTIGTRNNGSSYFFNGQIDDVRIYNYALTSEQIKQIYNGGAVNFR